jgi:four helix bundle protein
VVSNNSKKVNVLSRNFQELVVWKKAMELTKEVYTLVKSLPIEERYALSDQMRRAATSIPSNIAEGNGRNSTKEYVNFLAIARGSEAELCTQILLCVELGYVREDAVKYALSLGEEINRMLTAMIKKLNP